MAREATVIDVLAIRVAEGEIVDTQITLPLIHQSKRFVLDGSSTQWLMDMVQNNAKLIHELREFALAPYERMIVAFDHMRFVNQPGREGWVVLVLNNRKVVSLLYNSTTQRFEPLSHEGGDALEHEWTRLVTLAFYLALASRRALVTSEQPEHRTASRGRQVRYYSHSTINIDLTAPKITRRCFSTGTHASPRRHQVMGHFVHRGGDRSCSHQWERQPGETPKRWCCSACERKRVWRAAFERGDAGKGFVRQDYQVTA